MNRKYALPAALALAAHALIFFVGSGKPPAPATAAISSKPKEPPKPVDRIFEQTLQLVKEEIKNIGKPDDEGGGGKKDDIIFPPGVLEPPPRGPIDFTRGTQDYRPTVTGPGDKIPRNLPGWGDGDGSGSGNGIFSPTLLDAPPSTRYQKDPVYPAGLRNSGTAGAVWVEFLVTENGRVQNVKVIKSTHHGFDDATVAAVSEWRFMPGKHKGLPVRFRMSMPVVFSLSE